MRTAVVHDWLNGMRGGEKVLEEILRSCRTPRSSPSFTFRARSRGRSSGSRSVASFLNRLPFSRAAVPGVPPALSASRRVVRPLRLRPRGLLVPLRRQGSSGPGGSAPPLLLPHPRPVRMGPVRRLLPARDDAALSPQEHSHRPAARVGPRDRGKADPVPRELLGRRRPDPPPLRPFVGGVSLRPSTWSSSTAPRKRASRFSSRWDRSFRTSGTRWRSRRPAELGRPLVLVGKGPEERRLRALGSPSVQFVADLDRRVAARPVSAVFRVRPAGRGGFRHLARGGCGVRRAGRRSRPRRRAGHRRPTE